MNDLLTQEEIDALLLGIGDFDFEDESGRKQDLDGLQTDSRVRVYDFSSREKRVRGDLPGLDHVNERFTDAFSRSLSDFLGHSAEIGRSPVQVQQFSEYSEGLPLHTHLTAIKCPPLSGLALIALESRLVNMIVDRYFGGEGAARNSFEKKQLSPVMKRVMRLFLDLVVKDLKKAWKPVMELDVDYFSFDSDPVPVKISEPDDVIVISTIHIRLKGEQGDFAVAMPYSQIEPIRDVLNSPRAASPEDEKLWRTSFRDRFLQAEISVTSRVTETKMLFGDVMKLKKGDVIPIGDPGKAVLCVQGVPVFEGNPDVSQGRNVVKVVGRVSS